jgi:hypothetical protein
MTELEKQSCWHFAWPFNLRVKSYIDERFLRLIRSRLESQLKTQIRHRIKLQIEMELKK